MGRLLIHSIQWGKAESASGKVCTFRGEMIIVGIKYMLIIAVGTFAGAIAEYGFHINQDHSGNVGDKFLKQEGSHRLR